MERERPTLTAVRGTGDGHVARVAAEERKSIPTLLRDLVDEARRLVREEIRLAKAEIRESAGVAGRNLTGIALGAALGLAAVLALAAALTRGLTSLLTLWIDLAVAVWLAPLLMGLVLATASALLVLGGIRRIREQSLLPAQTKETLEEDKEWLLDKLH